MLSALGNPKDTRIVVAMSGGVDSSVVAVMLKEAGYDVIGMTLQLYDHGEAVRRPGACCAGQDIYDARRVAEAHNIPHYVLDYEDRFRQSVIEEFADSYLAGETPIPCVTCNQQVKFRDLYETAKDLGAAALATGHYIQSRNGTEGWTLHRALDSDRDQSYFLFGTTRDQLEFLRFPLGGMPKPEVRALAQSYGLVVADKSDSQDICFVPKGRYTDVISKLRPDALSPGNIVHVDGRVLGRHEGIINYTVGQRRGIGIAVGDPLYVVKLDPVLNQVVVGARDALSVGRVRLRDFNWLGDGALSDADGLECYAKVRSAQQPKPAILSVEGEEMKVDLIGGEDGVSPGQACVLYADETQETRVLGGGTIAETLSVAAMDTASRGQHEPALSFDAFIR